MRRLAAIGVIILSLTGAGVASATVHAEHGQHGPSCYATCATRTDLDASSHKVVFGSEQLEVFTVTVTPKHPHGSGTPTGTVTVAAEGTLLCSITLAGGSGSCSPSSSALPIRNQPYRVLASYPGDSNFASSMSHPLMLKVVSADKCDDHDGHGHGHGHANVNEATATATATATGMAMVTAAVAAMGTGTRNLHSRRTRRTRQHT